MEAPRDELAEFFATVLPHLNEIQRRIVAGAMAPLDWSGFFDWRVGSSQPR